MPCPNPTEILEIELTLDERFRAYSLCKQNQDLGAGRLIMEWLRPLTVNQVLTTRVETFLDCHTIPDAKSEFLLRKHFSAVQSALQLAWGEIDNECRGFCVIESIEMSDTGWHLKALISPKLLTDPIPACGHCGLG